jgi:hypothetical protein
MHLVARIGFFNQLPIKPLLVPDLSPATSRIARRRASHLRIIVNEF